MSRERAIRLWFAFLLTITNQTSELQWSDRLAGRLDIGTACERVVKLGEYLDFKDADMNKGYCRSLHTYEWFPDINAELRFPVCILMLWFCVGDGMH